MHPSIAGWFTIRKNRTLHLSVCLILSLCYLTAPPANAFIRDVPGTYATIQAAIDASFANDTVLVAEGTYFENIVFKGKTVVVSSLLAIDNDPQHIFNTIIDGSQPSSADSASVVRIVDGESRNSILQGFTITGGIGTKWQDPHGAGRYREGGGILTEAASPTIQYNIIRDNVAIDVDGVIVSAGGGGIRVGDGNPLIQNNIIMNNEALYGSAIVLNYSTGTINNNIIRDNLVHGAYSGGAIWSTSAGATTVNNNLIMDNIATGGYGGMFWWNTTAFLNNNIIRGNTPVSGNQIGSSSSSVVVSYCNVEGGHVGTANFDTEPVFYGNYYYLDPSSGEIDAGNPNAQYNDPSVGGSMSAAAQAKWPAMGTEINDVGAYGGPAVFSFERIAIVPDKFVGWLPDLFTFEAFSALTINSYNWNFKDGGSSTEPNPGHTFAAPGVYAIELSADTGGGTYTQIMPDKIVVLADTVKADNILTAAGAKIVVPIEVTNNAPLSHLLIPVEYAGDLVLTLDSISVVGCRTDYFETVQKINESVFFKRFTVELISSSDNSQPELDAGTGAVVNLHFGVSGSAVNGQKADISLVGYLSNLPLFEGSLAAYEPVSNSGLVALPCCVGSRGNANSDPDDKANIADVTFLVSFLFGIPAGPEPNCIEEANANGDPFEKVNIADVTFLVAYLFGIPAGPAPATCP